MFKKFCAVFLSLCIAAAMIVGVSDSHADTTETVTMCDMDAVDVLF